MYFIRPLKYLFLFTATFVALSAFAADAPRSRDDVYKIVKSAKTFGPRGYGYTFKSLDKLADKLTTADTPALLALLKDSDAATGASFGLAALCAEGLAALRPAIENDPQLPLDRARDVLHTIQHFEKCGAGTHATAKALHAEIDLAFEKRVTRALAAQKATQEELEQHNIRQMKQLDPAARKTLTQEERQQILDENTRALGLDGARTPEQELLYQKMKQSLMGDAP